MVMISAHRRAMLRIGLISDTHGLLRPEAEHFLRGCDQIVHAGDIGGSAVLAALQEIAPVAAVRGNNDTAEWAQSLPHTLALRAGGVSLFVLHDLNELKEHPHPPHVQVVICGHSHKPQVTRHPSGVLIINPGSAGPRRFKLPVSAAELSISAQGSFSARLVDLV
jgi:putative phosphoesterase